MRWLFLFVLSLNLAYIGWQVSQSSTAAYVDVPALKNVKTIVLLSELKPQADVVENGQVAEVESVDEVPVETLPVEPLPVEKAGGNEEGDAKETVADLSDVEAEPEALPESAEQTKTVSVVSEEVVSDEPPEPAVEAVQAARCFTLGPFRDLDELRTLIREIKSYVIEADFRGREEKERSLYWVYVKPEKNRARAIKTGKRLKAKKIKDFYVIRSGEKINGVSLGHFRSKKGAYGLAKKVRKLGFDVTVEPVYRAYMLYWLDYQLAAGSDIPESIFEKYTQPSKKQKISRLSRDCGS